jgi:hypothetical protein|tara:strand:- start:2620 stop:2880 length:261 start_codon:yes stop_codon:yes gene_type:complete
MSLIDHLRKQVKNMENVTTGTLMQEAEKFDRAAAAQTEGAIAVSQVYQEVLATPKKVAKAAKVTTSEAKSTIKNIKKATTRKKKKK